MRIVVTGATGNVGTSLLEALARDPQVEEIVGVARRKPAWQNPRTRFVQADVEKTDLRPFFAGADAVIHLAWLIQPSRDLRELARVNVHGSRKVFESAAEAGAKAIVHASSIGVYSHGPKDRPVDESWPREGTQSSFYSRHKVIAEQILDEIEGPRIVRLRPALIFKREAAAEIRRLFIGPILPSPLIHPKLLKVLPVTDRLVLQAVHSRDVGEAYRLAATNPDAHGAYNIAADPVLDPRPHSILKVDPRVLRALADLTWRARLQPTPPGWVDMGLNVPIMDTTRARTALGWTPTRTATEALLELVDGLRHSAGVDTPPLAPDAGGKFRIKELATGVGKRLTA
ncbi:MAG TPA: NAD-dependent epimerase/dehydratase family protein [Solirubrobacter sp.]|jgi:nucleoside-diphosphate-sugar epimerase|nr:NAD-dependent epimerase/dehydratase family protein [Solirubrobacter sp.]